MGIEQLRGRKRWAPIAAALLLAVVASRSFSDDAPVDEWKAPPRAAKKKNPIPSDAASVGAGKAVYAANCLACHGETGKGDGPAAININPKPHDLSDPKIVSQSDGELFWKITQGKKPMPSFDKLLSETDRWNVVNYIRTLAPPAASPSDGGKQ
jgi:mono/diheme cytochrome c family protein